MASVHSSFRVPYKHRFKNIFSLNSCGFVRDEVFYLFSFFSKISNNIFTNEQIKIQIFNVFFLIFIEFSSVFSHKQSESKCRFMFFSFRKKSNSFFCSFFSNEAKRRQSFRYFTVVKIKLFLFLSFLKSTRNCPYENVEKNQNSVVTQKSIYVAKTDSSSQIFQANEYAIVWFFALCYNERG